MPGVCRQTLLAGCVLLVLGVSFSACTPKSDSAVNQTRETNAVAQETPAGTETPEPAGSAVYTIFTYNVNGFDRGWNQAGARPKEHARIANIMKTNMVDIVNLTEVLQGEDAHGKKAQDVTDFNAALNNAGYPMRYSGSSGVSDGWNNIAYFSRYPVSQAREIGRSGFSPNWGGTRTVYRYKVTFPGNKQVWFYGCHLKSGQDSVRKRADEAAGLGKYIRQNHNVETEFIVVYGDMNTMNALDWPDTMGACNDNTPESGFDASKRPKGSPTGSAVALLEHRNQNDPSKYFTSLTRLYIYPETTMPGWPKSCPLDHIVLSPALYKNHYAAGSAKRVGQGTQGANGNPTDHYGVIAQLKF